jgi:hypothetical protein
LSYSPWNLSRNDVTSSLGLQKTAHKSSMLFPLCQQDTEGSIRGFQGLNKVSELEGQSNLDPRITCGTGLQIHFYINEE